MQGTDKTIFKTSFDFISSDFSIRLRFYSIYFRHYSPFVFASTPFILTHYSVVYPLLLHSSPLLFRHLRPTIPSPPPHYFVVSAPLYISSYPPHCSGVSASTTIFSATIPSSRHFHHLACCSACYICLKVPVHLQLSYWSLPDLQQLVLRWWEEEDYRFMLVESSGAIPSPRLSVCSIYSSNIVKIPSPEAVVSVKHQVLTLPCPYFK